RVWNSRKDRDVCHFVYAAMNMIWIFIFGFYQFSQRHTTQFCH
uniref:Uncharacterized protein n=1 Tax=Aegilops tauschii subsp. strangulata TaxID=200361 RepID=A0A453FXZ9_AEGTS